MVLVILKIWVYAITLLKISKIFQEILVMSSILLLYEPWIVILLPNQNISVYIIHKLPFLTDITEHITS